MYRHESRYIGLEILIPMCRDYEAAEVRYTFLAVPWTCPKEVLLTSSESV